MNNLAIIIPFRNRAAHLHQLLPALHHHAPAADVYVVEQCDDEPFNRGALLNAGFLEAPGYDYYCTHDVDMVPVFADYSYTQSVTHLATQASQFNYTMPYPEYLGGVTLFSSTALRTVNGYSNRFFGWGLEDDEMRRQLKHYRVRIDGRPCRFESLPHESNEVKEVYQQNLKLFRRGRMKGDGMSACRYTLRFMQEKEGFTHLGVELKQT